MEGINNEQSDKEEVLHLDGTVIENTKDDDVEHSEGGGGDQLEGEQAKNGESRHLEGEQLEHQGDGNEGTQAPVKTPKS